MKLSAYMSLTTDPRKNIAIILKIFVNTLKQKQIPELVCLLGPFLFLTKFSSIWCEIGHGSGRMVGVSFDLGLDADPGTKEEDVPVVCL